MRAVLYNTFQGPIELSQVQDPTPPAAGVVLKVKATGLCLSDWHGWMGHDADIHLPHIPGHELAGVVVACGNQVKKWKIGSRVTVPFVSGCGNCGYCLQGDPQVCNNQFQPGFTHWGSFAEFVAIDFADFNLVALPDVIDDATAAALGCRFSTAFRALKDQGKLSEGQWLVVFGCGGVGLSAIMIAKALNAKVIAVDMSQQPLNLAQALGADAIINSSLEESVPAIKELTSGGAHVSLDAFGSPGLVEAGLLCLRKRGKHLQVGLMPPEQQTANVSMNFVVANELEIIGSHGIQSNRFPEMLEMIVNGVMNPAMLISQTLSLGDSVEALPQMDKFEQGGIRIISDFTK